jgi:NAD-dependent deacetylase
MKVRLRDCDQDAGLKRRWPFNIVILTGAGISAESGLATFRAEAGLWAGHRIEDVCTQDALACNPDLVCGFYDERKRLAANALPNPAHDALAKLERFWRDAELGDFTLITQNVDDLHERAGSQSLIHMHGELNSVYCTECGFQFVRYGRLEGNRECPSCSQEALRPDIVFFGETPRRLPTIEAAIQACDLFVTIGTSGSVLPAAGFAVQARSHGAKTLFLNLEAPEFVEQFSDFRLGPASRTVPEWVRELVREISVTGQRSGRQ